VIHRKPWCKLDEPKWDPDGGGWIARARVTAVKKMTPGHRVTARGHTVTLEISEVDSSSVLYQHLVLCLIDGKDAIVRIEKDME